MADALSRQVPGPAEPLAVQRCGGASCPAGECEHGDEQVQRTGGQGVGPAAPDAVRQALASPGHSLDPGTRSFMEARLGSDLGAVRVHRDVSADRAARAVGARAFTAGTDVVFASGQYEPGSDAGRHTLAHELAHVVQQGRGAVDGRGVGGGMTVSDPGDRFERAAERTAVQTLSAQSPTVRPAQGDQLGSHAGSTQVQRIGPAAVAGIAAGVAGGAYLLWALHCLRPLDAPMRSETWRFMNEHTAATGRPMKSREWDAFGHCWVACEGTKKCGATTTAIAGKSREFYREFLSGAPHDSYQQDTNNQTTGRGFGAAAADCYVACGNGIRTGTLDLSAPESECYQDGRTYPAPC